MYGHVIVLVDNRADARVPIYIYTYKGDSVTIGMF